MPLPCPQSISEAEYRALPEKERLAYIATDKKVRRVRLRAAAVRLTWVGEEPPPPLQGALKGGSQAASGSSPFGADSAPPEVRFPVGSTVNVVGYGEAIVEEAAARELLAQLPNSTSDLHRIGSVPLAAACGGKEDSLEGWPC